MKMKLLVRRRGDLVNPKNQKHPKSLKRQKNLNLKGMNSTWSYYVTLDIKIFLSWPMTLIYREKKEKEPKEPKKRGRKPLNASVSDDGVDPIDQIEKKPKR